MNMTDQSELVELIHPYMKVVLVIGIIGQELRLRLGAQSGNKRVDILSGMG